MPVDQLAVAAGWPDDPDRSARVAAGLVAHGLAVDDGYQLALPWATGRDAP